MSECTSGRNRELDQFAECMSNARVGDAQEAHEKRQVCIQEMEEEGYEYLGGTTRAVFLMPHGDCVAKISKRGPGDHFNKREIERSQKEGFQGAVVPVDEHATDSSWLTMPTVENPAWGDIPWDDVKEVKSKLKEGGWVCKDIDRSNVGYMNGEPVAFDYAEGCKRMEDTNALGR